MSSMIKLIPVTTDYSMLLNAVNGASTVEDLKSAVETYGNDFLDVNALKYMDGAYSEILAQKPAQGFKSAYYFKTIFDTAVDNRLTKVKVNSSSFVWQVSQSYVDNYGYRINWEPVELKQGGDSRAVVTFKISDTLNIKALKLKLNPYMTESKFSDNALINGYSSDIIELPNGNREQNKFINSVNFENLDNPIKVTASEKEITDDAIIDAISENGYISFRLIGETIAYQGVEAQNKYALGATLEVIYDNTYNPKMSMSSSKVNNESVKTSKVFDLTGFDRLDSVTVNKAVLDKSKYLFNGSRLLIDASVFENPKTYTVEVSEGTETRNAVIQLADEKIIYAQDSEKATWSVSSAQNLNNSMTRPDESHNLLGVSSSSDTSIIYSSIPSGVYDVYTYYPKWLSTVPYSEGRTSGIYDAGAEITDANGTYKVKSTKPSINFEGYTSVGTYEFSGNGDEKIKFFVNKDYSDIVKYMGTPYFTNYAIKLVPVSNEGFVKYYYDKGICFTDNLKKSVNITQFTETIKDMTDYVSDFIDINSLYDMSGVYSKLYHSASNTGFKTEWEFKTAFDKAVSDYIEFKEIPSSLMLSTYTDDGENLKVIYKKNSTASLLDIEKSYASVTFDGISELEPDAIIDVWLKINATTYADDYYLTKYSEFSPTIIISDNVSDGILDGNSEENVECNVWFSCFSPINEKLLTPFFVNVDKTQLKETVQKGLPLTYYIQIKNKIKDYNDVNTFTGATLKIGYDTTYKKSVLKVAGEISTAETFEQAKELAKKYASVFGIEQEQCDTYALALWNERIETADDIDNCINVPKDDCYMNKSVEILTDSEYIGGVTVKNFGTSETSVKVIAALYDSFGKLIGMDYADREKSLSAGDAFVYAFSVDVPKTDTGYSVKVFAWGDMINIVPLTDALEHK